MALDETLINEIFLSIRGAPHSSVFRNENELLLELSTPIVRELDLSVDTDIEHGLMQWIGGHLILNPKIIENLESTKIRGISAIHS